MTKSHYVQLVLAAVVACGGAAVPLLVTPMTPTAWLLLAIAEAAALQKVLSVQSEVAGDKPASQPNAAAKAAAVKVVGSMLLMIAIIVLSGCISDAPIVPVTPANQSQVSSCQSTAALHNDVVVGDFVIGAGVSGLATGAAAVDASNSSLKTALAITSAGLGAVGLVGTALAGLTASAFSNSQCSTVVGALPTASTPPAPSPPPPNSPAAAPVMVH